MQEMCSSKQSYILRYWRGSATVWRYELMNAHTRQSYFSSDIAELVQILERVTRGESAEDKPFSSETN